MTADKQPYCSQIARQDQISLIGTATRADNWFLVEYPAAWESKAFEGSQIPDEVKDYLTAAVEGVRVLLIRKTGKAKHKGLHFFAIQGDALEPKMYGYQIDDYTDLLEIDLSYMTSGRPGDPAHLREKPLYLACANGKRDRCCAKFGMQVFKAMSAIDPEAVWQSSHIGGHNKAPVTLFFPHGLNYGMTSSDDIRNLMGEYQRGRVGLEFYRGRVVYDTHLQAGEHFWREHTGILDLPGMEVVSVEELGDNEWWIDVHGVDGADHHSFHVRQEVSDIEIPMTCSGKKVEKLSRFVWVE
ncbi:MAG: hypothetical protein JW757_11330 [Anaerolineales bacterium]|nr:hypothetical protein [Anaerolineales bacterium]